MLTDPAGTIDGAEAEPAGTVNGPDIVDKPVVSTLCVNAIAISLKLPLTAVLEITERVVNAAFGNVYTPVEALRAIIHQHK